MRVKRRKYDENNTEVDEHSATRIKITDGNGEEAFFAFLEIRICLDISFPFKRGGNGKIGSRGIKPQEMVIYLC